MYFVGIFSAKDEKAGSVSADPDPDSYQNVKDPQHYCSVHCAVCLPIP